MKFLLFSLVLCLVAGAMAVLDEEDGPTVDADLDFSSTTTTEVQTKRYKFTWMEQLLDGLKAGGGQNLLPPIEGSANAIVTGVLETSRGSLKGLEPGIQGVYMTPVPTIRIILAGSKIKVCGPQTHVEFLLNHVICFVNGPLHLGLGVSPLPICIKGREKQCHGPFMRLPDTLTPQQIADGSMGLTDASWVGNTQLQEIDESGNVIDKIPIESNTGPAPDSPDSSLVKEE